MFQINVTLHDTFTTDRDVKCDPDPDIRFMRQTFECTREAARELQTKLELLILIGSAESRVLSLPEFKKHEATPDYDAWIERGNFSDNARQYLRCVANSGNI